MYVRFLKVGTSHGGKTATEGKKMVQLATFDFSEYSLWCGPSSGAETQFCEVSAHFT